MKRKDKEIIPRSVIDGIIRDSEYCHLSCCVEEQPYLIPVSFGYDGETIYIHTALTGKKIDYFEKNPRVCLSFVSQAELISHPNQACDWSFNFASVIAEGIIKEVLDTEEKTSAINQIMTHYSGNDWDIPKKSLTSTRVWKITLDKLTGKRSPTV